MKADRYLPWSAVSPGAAALHRGLGAERASVTPAEVLEGGCLLYHLPRAASRRSRPDRAATASRPGSAPAEPGRGSTPGAA